MPCEVKPAPAQPPRSKSKLPSSLSLKKHLFKSLTPKSASDLPPTGEGGSPGKSLGASVGSPKPRRTTLFEGFKQSIRSGRRRSKEKEDSLLSSPSSEGMSVVDGTSNSNASQSNSESNSPVITYFQLFQIFFIFFEIFLRSLILNYFIL